MSNDTAQEAPEAPEAPEAAEATEAPDAQEAPEAQEAEAQPSADAHEAQEMELNLGRCHYGDFDEEAVAVAASPDGGWIAVCEEHKQRAQEEGYELHDAD